MLEQIPLSTAYIVNMANLADLARLALFNMHFKVIRLVEFHLPQQGD